MTTWRIFVSVDGHIRPDYLPKMDHLREPIFKPTPVLDCGLDRSDCSFREYHAVHIKAPPCWGDVLFAATEVLAKVDGGRAPNSPEIDDLRAALKLFAREALKSR